jgi:membrane associated rhomboid family serine protease
MSIAVGVCTIAFSIFTFRSLDQAITRTMKHEGYRVSIDLAEEFTTKWCETEQIKILDCNRLKSRLTGFNLLSKANFVTAFEARLTAKKSSTASTLFSDENGEQLNQFADKLFAKLTSAPEWVLWKEHVHGSYQKGHWLTSKTLSFISVMKAQFAHGGWIHLLGNMIFFFAFAGALEMRVGIGAWLALYLVGGSSAMILQSTSLPEGVPLVGASAGISALAGAYLVFFWRHSTRVLFSAIVFNKVILIPTFAFVLIMLVSQDIAGSLGALSSTAHLAHLSGLMFGAVFAFIHRLFIHGDLAFLYPHEQDLFEQAQDSKEALAIYDQILVWNPENMIVRDLAFAEVNKDHVPQKARTAFYKYHLEETFSQLRRDKDYDRLIQIARDVIQSGQPKNTISLLTQVQCISLIRILSLLEVPDVFDQWVSVTAEAHPTVKQNAQFRMLASKVNQNDQEAISA